MSDTPSGAIQRAEGKRDTRKALRRLRPVKSFYMMTHDVWRSPQRKKLSGRANKLLIDLCCQYSGFNNGDLTTAWAVMRD